LPRSVFYFADSIMPIGNAAMCGAGSELPASPASRHNEPE
jgi:hypothetical protein